MKFSILIPVYNVEKYLEQCLCSVISQDFKDFEIILVNDGSTDQSSMMCQKLAKADSRIKYYDKANEGLLLTRRYSIKRASGDYILFLDSDDYWEPGILSKLSKQIEAINPDLICYRFRKITDDGKPISDDIGVFKDGTLFNLQNKEVFLTQFVKSPRLNPLWSKCVRSSIIDKEADYSRFDDKKGEDLLQSIALIRNANTILYLDDVFVNYRQTPFGRARTFKIKYIDDYEIVKNHIYSNLIGMRVSESVMDVFFVRYIEGLIGYLELLAINSKDINSFKEICDRINNYNLYKKVKNIVKVKDIQPLYRLGYMCMLKYNYSYIYYFYIAKKAIKKILIR